MGGHFDTILTPINAGFMQICADLREETGKMKSAGKRALF